MNKSAVRRALTTLKKNGVIVNQGWNGDDFIKNKISLVVNVDAELVQPKKRVYIRKTKTKKDYTADGGMSN